MSMNLSKCFFYSLATLLFAFFFSNIQAQNFSNPLITNIHNPIKQDISMPLAMKEDATQFRKIFDEELVNGKSYVNLHSLCTEIGARISGSAKANLAVKWGVEKLKSLGLDSIYTQAVMVPHWERGDRESGYIHMGSHLIKVPICALGGSIATPKGGLKAEIVEVQNFEQLAKLGRSTIEGKIVFYNRAFDQRFIVTGDAYGNAVDQRVMGAIEASKFGAVGVVIRSMSSSLDTFPHTGIMFYKEGIKKIPAAAISTLAADELAQDLKTNPHLTFSFNQSCKILPDVKSYNVVGELKGQMFPNEIILIGGHLDSWDLAQGAQDDGAGIVQSMEVLQIFKSLALKPKRTIRVVFFMSEENGSSGGIEYANIASKNTLQHHIAAIESDDGGFTPRGFGISAPDSLRGIFEAWRPLFAPYGSSDFTFAEGGGGADIEKLGKQSLSLIGYNSDSQRYFDLHHTANDLFTQVNQRELKLGAASISALVYLIDKYGL